MCVCGVVNSQRLGRASTLEWIVSAQSAYRVLPRSRPPGAAIRTVATVPQPSAPTPGPSLEVVLRGRRATFSARLLVEAPI